MPDKAPGSAGSNCAAVSPAATSRGVAPSARASAAGCLVSSIVVHAVTIAFSAASASWPPRFGGQVDQARMRWLTHPALDAAELRLGPDLAALVATRRFPA